MEEFNFSSFVEENKKVLIIAGIGLVIIIGLVVLSLFGTPKENNEESNYVGGVYVDPLPQADVGSEPILFDYEQGSLGYQADIKFEDKFMNYCYVIAADTSTFGGNDGDICITMYSGVGVLPAIGTNYKGYHLDGDQWKIVSGRISNWPEELSEIEGNYKFCALCNLGSYNLEADYPEYSIDENIGSATWCDIDFKSINYGVSRFQENYINEKGYPTEWVRKFNEKFHNGDQYIKNPIYVNFADEFWDKYNYRQIIRLKDPDGEIKKYMVTMVDTFSEVHEDKDENGDTHYDLTDKTLNSEMLERMLENGFTEIS